MRRVERGCAVCPRMMTCYDDVVRTIIELPENQLEALDGICRREEISRAEAIRQAVALLVRQRGAGTSGVAFGLWRGRRPGDGLQYQERLRREWPDARGRRKRPAKA
jgi:hypothetical protein